MAIEQINLFDFEEVISIEKPSSKALPVFDFNQTIIQAPKILTAAELFTPFFLETYIPMKHTKDRVDLIKNEMKERLREDDRKRIEYDKLGLIAKWRVVPKYETDYIGINELLYDHGLLQLISMPTKGLEEEVKEQIEPFKLPTEYYVVPTVTTKKAKAKMAEAYEELLVEDMASDNLLGLFSRYHNVNKMYEDQYEAIKKQLITDPILLEKKKVTFEYGSIGLREKNVGYDIDTLIDFLGVDFLIQHGKPDMQALDYFIDIGVVDRKEVESFRKEIDRRLDFLLMTKESEAMQFEIYQKKLQRRAKRITV